MFFFVHIASKSLLCIIFLKKKKTEIEFTQGRLSCVLRNEKLDFIVFQAENTIYFLLFIYFLLVLKFCLIDKKNTIYLNNKLFHVMVFFSLLCWKPNPLHILHQPDLIDLLKKLESNLHILRILMKYLWVQWNLHKKNNFF